MEVKLKEIYSEDFLAYFGDKSDLVGNIVVDSEATSVDVEKIIDSIGINQKETKLETHSGKFNSDEYTIYVNRSEPKVRQRFTQAHELGHCVLGHKGESARLINSANYRLHERLNERAANQFAAELLMPKYYIKKSIEKLLFEKSMTATDLPKYSVKEFITYLANDLDVSKQSMEYRLLNLGVIRNV
ncbi:ImmA/IrrE family metallo-endopeptidase [uncultured Streptococcus sp.]|uniref:ImmA/IrrE family metallo-endopeptidase n=1 Tax=uncultured Streptococcus sp. TaxID=83427 RepID=UPI002597E222|nr:ImmA/IrrE family metallo-endopeptidase [uncultured Streptococcus sp.]